MSDNTSKNAYQSPQYNELVAEVAKLRKEIDELSDKLIVYQRDTDDAFTQFTLPQMPPDGISGDYTATIDGAAKTIKVQNGLITSISAATE